MILLTRLNGTPLGVNADLIERVDVTPDTVVTLVDGKKFVVTEPIETVIARVVAFRASVLAATEDHVVGGAPAGGPYPGGPYPGGSYPAGPYPGGSALAPSAVRPRPLRLLSGTGGDVEGEA